MSWYKIIFFHVFKRYYKDGKFINDIPWLTTSVIVGVSSSFYLLSLTVLFYFFFIDHDVPQLNKYPILICGFVFAVANYFLLDVGGAFQGWGDPLLTPKK